AKAAQSAYDETTANKAIEAFLSNIGVDGALTKDNIGLLLQGATSSKSAAYAAIRDHMKEVDALLAEINNPKRSNEILSGVLSRELVMPKMSRQEYKEVDFDGIQ